MQPYVFEEYPKWVTLPDGSQAIVQDTDEEDALLGPEEPQDGQSDNPDSPAPKRRGRPPKAR